MLLQTDGSTSAQTPGSQLEGPKSLNPHGQIQQYYAHIHQPSSQELKD